jgi:glutathione S-transferase
MGHRFTAVDVMVGGALAWGLEHAPRDDLLDAYVARVAARPANARAMAKDAPEASVAA